MKGFVYWFFQSWIAIDQLVNAVCSPIFNLFHCGRPFNGPFGDADETISSVIGKVRRANDGKIPRKHFIMRVVDRFLELIDRDHTIEAIEDDEGRR